jgi:hypothetical protein
MILERETGIEPATFSLGNRPSIENNQHSVSGYLVLAMEITENLRFGSQEMRMEHKWSTGTVRLVAKYVAYSTSKWRPQFDEQRWDDLRWHLWAGLLIRSVGHPTAARTGLLKMHRFKK